MGILSLRIMDGAGLGQGFAQSGLVITSWGGGGDYVARGFTRKFEALAADREWMLVRWWGKRLGECAEALSSTVRRYSILRVVVG